MHNSGALRRGIAESYLAVIARSGLSAEAQRAKAEATKQSILSLRRYGLLRCARKDVDGAHLPTRYSVIARSSCDEAIHTFFAAVWIASLCSQRRGWGPSANTILRHCEELLRRSNPYFLCAAVWIASLCSQRRGWGSSANTILRHCEELLRRSNPYFLCAAAWIASLCSQRRGWGSSANTILRHCEELLRRSNPHFLCGGMDCFAVLAKTWMGSICQHDNPAFLGALETKHFIPFLVRR